MYVNLSTTCPCCCTLQAKDSAAGDASSKDQAARDARMITRLRSEVARKEVSLQAVQAELQTVSSAFLSPYSFLYLQISSPRFRPRHLQLSALSPCSLLRLESAVVAYLHG